MLPGNCHLNYSETLKHLPCAGRAGQSKQAYVLSLFSVTVWLKAFAANPRSDEISHRGRTAPGEELMGAGFPGAWTSIRTFGLVLSCESCSKLSAARHGSQTPMWEMEGAGLMVVITSALGRAAVFICWLELHTPCSGSASAGLTLTEADLLAPAATWHQSPWCWYLIRPEAACCWQLAS